MESVTGGGLISSFTNDDGLPIVVDKKNAVFTVCSRSDVWSGGHSFCYLEFIYQKQSTMVFMDLVTPGHGRVQLRDHIVQKATKKDGVITNNVDNELRHYDTMKHHSYAITTDQAEAILAAYDKFTDKVDNGRYAYSLPGGKLGRVLGVLKGQRGVNCADFIFKILSDAGVAHIDDKLFNTPRYAAGSSNR